MSKTVKQLINLLQKYFAVFPQKEPGTPLQIPVEKSSTFILVLPITSSTSFITIQVLIKITSNQYL